jgi:hypothetical protein
MGTGITVTQCVTNNVSSNKIIIFFLLFLFGVSLVGIGFIATVFFSVDRICSCVRGFGLHDLPAKKIKLNLVLYKSGPKRVFVVRLKKLVIASRVTEWVASPASTHWWRLVQRLLRSLLDKLWLYLRCV